MKKETESSKPMGNGRKRKAYVLFRDAYQEFKDHYCMNKKNPQVWKEGISWKGTSASIAPWLLAVENNVSANIKVLIPVNPASTSALVMSHHATKVLKKNCTAITRSGHHRAIGQVVSKVGVEDVQIVVKEDLL